MKSMFIWTTALTLLVTAVASAADAQRVSRKRKATDWRFREMDANGDKRLTETEFIGEAKKEAREKAKREFMSFDRDRNHVITHEEFKAIKMLLTQPGQNEARFRERP